MAEVTDKIQNLYSGGAAVVPADGADLARFARSL
jgi:hypothetical protein